MKTTVVSTCDHDHEYNEFSSQIRKNFSASSSEKLFMTDSENLFDLFLDSLPTDRQHYVCHACRRFVNSFGGLISINESGLTTPVMWPTEGIPAFFKNAVDRMYLRVSRAKVTGVFYSKSHILGEPMTGGGDTGKQLWHHMSVEDCPAHHHILKTPFQESAEKKEDFKNMNRALEEFSIKTITQAVTLLKNDNLYRSEKVLGCAKWLKEVHDSLGKTKHEERQNNMLWRFIANAPEDFCHPRSSMIGTLLDDLESDMDFSQAERRFADKMHPLKYQRPQALPSQGNIEQAEKIVEKLGIARSLERRFARLDEIESIWEPKNIGKKESEGGIFSHLETKEKPEQETIVTSEKTITWEKFSKNVLPEAEKIELYIGHGGNSYAALVTATHEDAPPILQWDKEELRNPVSHYLYSGGSAGHIWGLQTGEYCVVNAVCFEPSMWNEGKYSHQGKGVMFILEGAKDTRNSSLALFPETLKSELRAIRSTIESFSSKGKISGEESASACGLLLQSNGNWNAKFVVTSSGIKSKYKLDRWD